MNILHLNDCRFDTRVIMSPEVFLNLMGTTYAVKVERRGDNRVHPVYVATDLDTGEELLIWSSLEMRPSEFVREWFTIDVHEPYSTQATLIVPVLGDEETSDEDDDFH